MSQNVPHVFPDARAAAFACGELVMERLREGVAARGRATLAVSGGSTPKLLFEYMRGVDFPWEKLLFFFVDERAVPPDDRDSNYALAKQNFLEPAGFPAENVVRAEGELPFREGAEKYGRAIRERFHLDAGAMPEFDVIHQGMGPDGHTASLFPGEPLLENRTGLAAAVIGTKLPPERITLLPGVLLAARSTVYLVDGEDKQEAFDAVLSGPDDVRKWPSQLLSRSGKRVDWFVANLRWPEGA